MALKLTDLGEIRLIDEVFLPGVTGDPKGDDCAFLPVGEGELILSIDPCPTPVANFLGICTPETWGNYTATINLSDVAACGGTPVGMLVSLELEDRTEVEFVEGFQRGLLSVLDQTGAVLLGGNVKSSDRFRATGTAIGKVRNQRVTRTIAEPVCAVYVVGHCGSFWAGVVGQLRGWHGVPMESSNRLLRAVVQPRPQSEAGMCIGDLEFEVACMDCSDGLGSALQQLAAQNMIDIELEPAPDWSIEPEARAVLAAHGINTENACYQFGDWQLVCLVPTQRTSIFEDRLKDYPLTKLGTTRKGAGDVRLSDGRMFAKSVMNKNFAGGYNSIVDAQHLIHTYLEAPVFSE